MTLKEALDRTLRRNCFGRGYGPITRQIKEWINFNLQQYTGLFVMIVGVLTTCHTQYTWYRSIFFLFNRTTLQVFVTYLTGALNVHPLWFYKHQHDNRVRSKLFVACQSWWFQWRFWFVPSVPGYKGCTYRAPVRYVTKTWSVVLLNKKTYILLSQVYCVWQVVKTPTLSSNNPVFERIGDTSITK